MFLSICRHLLQFNILIALILLKNYEIYDIL